MFNTTAYSKAVVKYIQAVKSFQIFLRSGYLDMWKLFLCQFQCFNFPKLDVLYVVEIWIFLVVLGSPSRVRLCGILRRFGDLRKNTPLEFWSMYLVYFIDFCWFLLILYDFKCFAGFRVSQQGASVWLPAALRRLQKKHPFGVLEYVSCGFCHFQLFHGPPSPLRLCRAACGASAPSEKTLLWSLGVSTLCVLTNFVAFILF